jgi:hypothetical protein
MLRSETAIWARHHGATLVELDREDWTAYWRLLAHHWRAPGDLLLVEQDILPAPGVTTDMLACDHLWCSSPYWSVNRWLPDGLGCARFSEALKRSLPDALVHVGRMHDGDGAQGVWWLLDHRLSGYLRSAGHEPHEHERSTHLHEYGGSHG